MYRYIKVRDGGGSNRTKSQLTVTPCPPTPPKSFKITDYYCPPDNGKSKQKVSEKPLILAVFGKSLTSLLN